MKTCVGAATKSCIVAMGLLLVLAGGCSEPITPGVPTRTSDDPAFSAVWDASMDVLREYRFAVDRSDRREGVITTYPLLGRQCFEFWRKDAVTVFDVAEGTLQTIDRQVTILIQRDPQSGAYKSFSVEARTSRSDQDTVEVTSASGAYRMFIKGYELEQTESTKPKKLPYVDLGRDVGLEQVIARKIHKRSMELLPSETAAAARQ